MARDPDRRREENAPTVLTRRSSVWSLWSVSAIASGTRETRATGRQGVSPASRFMGVELFVTKRGGPTLGDDKLPSPPSLQSRRPAPISQWSCPTPKLSESLASFLAKIPAAKLGAPARPHSHGPLNVPRSSHHFLFSDPVTTRHPGRADRGGWPTIHSTRRKVRECYSSGD
jgi:hypothetical protein